MHLRILLIAMGPLLSQIVENAVRTQASMMIVGSVDRFAQAQATAMRVDANVLVVSEDASLAAEQVVGVLREHPKWLVCAIAADGRRATQYVWKEHVLHEQTVDDLSPRSLVAAIYAAARELNLLGDGESDSNQ